MLSELAEAGVFPDRVVRFGIRRLLAQRLRDEERRHQPGHRGMLDAMARAPVAALPEAANAQHYEVPPAFFEAVLGPQLKYSACYWAPGTDSLAEAEEAMLERTAEHAQLADGQRILELGCGWGSLTLWMARRFPSAEILAVSNSAPQREFIMQRARRQRLANLRVVTADINDFAAGGHFDRVVSVEMFEHVRNQLELLRRIADWMAPDGKLFVHLFCHRRLAYFFARDGRSDWMAQHFFSGGMMPALDLLPSMDTPLKVAQHWPINGGHYQRTAEAWLENLDARREAAAKALEPVYGASTKVWLQRWRMFFMACAELFGYRAGNEWLVGHYLLTHREERSR